MKKPNAPSRETLLLRECESLRGQVAMLTRENKEMAQQRTQAMADAEQWRQRVINTRLTKNDLTLAIAPMREFIDHLLKFRDEMK